LTFATERGGTGARARALHHQQYRINRSPNDKSETNRLIRDGREEQQAQTALQTPPATPHANRKPSTQSGATLHPPTRSILERHRLRLLVKHELVGMRQHKRLGLGLEALRALHLGPQVGEGHGLALLADVADQSGEVLGLVCWGAVGGVCGL